MDFNPVKDPLPDLVVQCAGCQAVLSDSREVAFRAELDGEQVVAVRGELTAAAASSAVGVGGG